MLSAHEKVRQATSRFQTTTVLFCRQLPFSPPFRTVKPLHPKGGTCIIRGLGGRSHRRDDALGEGFYVSLDTSARAQVYGSSVHGYVCPATIHEGFLNIGKLLVDTFVARRSCGEAHLSARRKSCRLKVSSWIKTMCTYGPPKSQKGRLLRASIQKQAFRHMSLASPFGFRFVQLSAPPRHPEVPESTKSAQSSPNPGTSKRPQVSISALP